MSVEIFVSFLENMFLLSTLAIVYFIFKSDSFFHPILRKLIIGFLVSGIVVFVMWNSYKLLEVGDGILFDTRAVLLSVSGMFFGLIPTVMAGIAAIIMRIIQGGVGTFTGILWIVVSAFLGLLWRKYRLKRNSENVYKINWIELYIFALGLQIIMILLLFTMPGDLGLKTINEVAFPLLVIYPVGHFVISQFLLLLRRQYFNDLKTLESERQYRRLFTHNNTLLMLVDSKTYNIVDVNVACVDVYGYSIEEFKKLNISSITVLPKEELFEDLDQHSYEQNTYYAFKHISKAGIVFDVEVSTSPIMLNNQEYLYFTITDISEKVQSERMFKDADERLRTTLISIGEGVVVTDEHARITLVNDKAKKLINIDEDIERKKVFEIFRIYSNQNEEDFKTLYNTCLESNTMFRSDNTYSLLTHDKDNVIFIDFTISPINNEHGVNHGAILVFRDITIEKERQEEIRFMSKHDYLTKLYNRFSFEQEIQRLDVSRQLPISLVIGDINGLKLVNDAFGHLEGDKLIREVADIFKKSTRSEDIVARWGGDEFAILLPQTSYENAETVTKRIQDLCSKSLYDIITPSVSIGIATKTSDDQSITDILTTAEERMYNQKTIEGPLMREQLITRLLGIIDEKIASNVKHVENIVDIMTKYCDFYGFEEDKKREYVQLAKYHDIGRIGVDESIWNKKKPLTDIEWTRIRSHSEIGSRLLATIPELQHISKPVLEHHENFDGTGYPQGLKGNEIDERARLLSIIDSYEAMTSDRSYRQAKSHEEALNEILRCTNTQFDPKLVKKFIHMFD